MRLYHSTPHQFDTFSLAFCGESTTGFAGNGGLGCLYVSQFHDDAQKWGKRFQDSVVLGFDIDDSRVVRGGEQVMQRFSKNSIVNAIQDFLDYDGFPKNVEGDDGLVSLLNDDVRFVEFVGGRRPHSFAKKVLKQLNKIGYHKYVDFDEAELGAWTKRFYEGLGIAAVHLTPDETLIYDLSAIGEVRVEGFTGSPEKWLKQGWKPGAVVIAAGNMPVDAPVNGVHQPLPRAGARVLKNTP